MPDQAPNETSFERMQVLLGDAAMQRLAQSRVAIFGLGGVGGHCAQALARCGVGHFLLVDADTVSLSNINRQAVALHSTLGQRKVDVMRAQILDINPQAAVRAIAGFYLPADDLGVWAQPVDLVIDAIDTLTAKADLALQAQARGIPCVSCMGAGNKLDASRFEVADLFDTSVCPLCRAMRDLARHKGIARLRVVYSKEPPARQAQPRINPHSGRPLPGSIAYVTASAGLLLAQEAVRMLLADAGT